MNTFEKALLAAFAAAALGGSTVAHPDEPYGTLSTGTGTPPVFEVVATNHRFVLPTSEIPSGWTTLRLVNESDETHFMLLERLPEGATFAAYEAELVPPFQEAMDLIAGGDVDAGFARLDELPAWYGDIRMMGGPGLIEPGGTATTTLYLEPGTYAIECYVKTPDGTFHVTLGMLAEITVAEVSTDAVPPTPDLNVRLGNGAIVADRAVPPGRHTVAVHFDEHLPDAMNDVHLVRVDEGTDMDVVSDWMDWSRPAGFLSPAPAAFLGGTNEMPVGHVAYLTLNLTAGDYAWIVERPAGAPLHEAFTVPETRGR